jgi:hypothetical protein
MPLAHDQDMIKAVCAENLVRFVQPAESPNVDADACAVRLLAGLTLVAMQVEEPT